MLEKKTKKVLIKKAHRSDVEEAISRGDAIGEMPRRGLLELHQEAIGKNFGANATSTEHVDEQDRNDDE